MSDGAMAWIETVPEGEEDSEEVREAYERYRSFMGYVSKFIQLFSLRPETIAPLTAFQSVLGFGNSSLSKRREEMLNVSISALNDCRYCQVSHTHSLRKMLDEKEAEQILDSICNWDAIFHALNTVDTDGASLQEIDRADLRMLAFAHKLTTTPGDMQRSDVEILRQGGFTDTQILDVVLLTAWRNFVNRVCEGLGVEPEETKTFLKKRI